MPKKPDQKLRLLYMKEILERYTDEEHGISRKEFETQLSHHGIDAPTRKTFYDDLDTLEAYDMDIARDPYGKEYKLLSREFDLLQIKLIIDAIQANKSIPEQKTREIVGQLKMLCSKYQEKTLDRDVITTGRVKTLNEGTQNNIDHIHAAIADDRQISTLYFDYDMDLKKHYRRRGGRMTLSPFALVYSDENYYLLAYDAKLEEIRTYRVDRMEKVVEIEESVREGKEEFAALDMTKYSKYTFGMFKGDIKEVTMIFTKDMVNTVIDRFGRDIIIHKEDKDHFHITVSVAVSQQFYGWVFGLGKKAAILGPEDVRQGYLDMMRDIQERYDKYK